MIRFDTIVKDYYKDPNIIVMLQDKKSLIVLEEDAIVVGYFLHSDDFKFTDDESIITYLVFSEKFSKSLYSKLYTNKLNFVVLRENKVDKLKRFRQSNNKSIKENIRIRDLINETRIRKLNLRSIRNNNRNTDVDQRSHYEKIYQIYRRLDKSEIEDIDSLFADNRVSCSNCIEQLLHNCNKGLFENYECFVPVFRVAPGETENWPKEMEFNRKPHNFDFD